MKYFCEISQTNRKIKIIGSLILLCFSLFFFHLFIQKTNHMNIKLNSEEAKIDRNNLILLEKNFIDNTYALQEESLINHFKRGNKKLLKINDIKNLTRIIEIIKNSSQKENVEIENDDRLDNFIEELEELNFNFQNNLEESYDF
jgi:hypothetical protein